MKIAFRTDASIQIGTGHVMRCLTLANALQRNGAKCVFICRAHKGHLLDLLLQQGHETIALIAQEDATICLSENATAHAAWLGTDWATDAFQTQQAIVKQAFDWLVVDHYALDRQWETTLRPYCQQLMVIDDLADRAHDCDLLLNQNLGRSAEEYIDLVPSTSTKLIGPQYALLRPEFAELREESLARRSAPELKNLLVSLGGVDKTDVTSKVLQALCKCPLPPELRITVVMGQHAPWLTQVQTLAQSMPRPTRVLVNVKNMAHLMTESDLTIASAGGTAWELCSLGVPSVIIVLADNQYKGAKAIAEKGAALLIEGPDEIDPIVKKLFSINTKNSLLQALSHAACTITQGNGTSLVVNALEQLDV